ncbi:MAG: hypothetical protein GPJ23_22910 [Microcystis aeruginosa G13-05]|nr:hypothetical protein [Microcystis aeruginosa BS11-05]NCS54948.1 hypothetical protein [Microcystis aeruginosa G13-05]
MLQVVPVISYQLSVISYQETGDRRQETGDGRRETGDGRLFLFILPTSPRPHVPTSPPLTDHCLLITEKG